MQPSAEAARDFISFLNASPTRMDRDLWCWVFCLLIVESFPCGALSQAAALDGRLRRDQSRLFPPSSTDLSLLPNLIELLSRKGIHGARFASPVADTS